MTRYRKKPVEVEAIQLTWSNWNEICDFVDKEYFGGGVYLDLLGNEMPEGQGSDIIGLKINTLEGIMLAVQDDYIIKGIQGEFYSCKPDIFHATYEKVD